MKQYNVVAGVVFYKNKVLCLQKGQNKYDYISYHWEFPGGKIELGETPEEALTRELREELNMNVNVCEHIITVEHEYADFMVVLHAYKCIASANQFVLNEHVRYKWADYTTIMSLDWCAADVPIARVVVSAMNR